MYVAYADLNGDGLLNASDRQLLIANFGFVAAEPVSVNLPPVCPVFTLEPDADTAPVGDSRTTLATVTLVGQTDPGTMVRLNATGQTYVVGGGMFYFPEVPLTWAATRLRSRRRERTD